MKKNFLNIFLIVISLFIMGSLRCRVSTKYHSVTTPYIVSGPSEAKVDESVTFTSSSSFCFKGCNILYRFDFGDGTISSWSTSRERSHSYSERGTYKVHSQAKCSEKGVTSSWSRYKSIDIIENKILSNTNKTWINDLGILWGVGDKGEIFYNKDDKFYNLNSNTKLNLYGVYGNKNEEIFVVGEKGIFITIDKFKCNIHSIDEQINLYDVKGIDSTLFIAGDSGNIFIIKENKTQEKFNLGNIRFNSLWIENISSVFIVGDKGAIFHYNGVNWKKMDSGTQNNLYSVWGNHYTNVFAVGDKGTILKFDGNSWININRELEVSFKSIDGNKFEVFIAGNNGNIIKYDGKKIEKIKFDFSNDIKSINLKEKDLKIFGYNLKTNIDLTKK